MLMLAGFCFSFFWAHSMTSLSPSGIADHYRGSDTTFGEPMSFRELAEVTHFHLFTMPVVFMILVHVTYLTNATSGLKALVTWGGFGGVMLDVRLTNLRADNVDRRHADDAEFSRDDGHSDV
jgi:hypothetical protein